MTFRNNDPALAAAVTLAAVTILMQQVAGKAARDAMFLAHFPVSSLPAMIMVSSILSIVAGLLFSRTLAKISPSRLLPAGFAGSAAFLLLTWWAAGTHPKLAATFVYLQMAAVSPVLISAFWSALNERFDPYEAKQLFGRVGAGASVGGLIGGVLAGWVATASGLLTMLPVLALLNLISAVLVIRLRGSANRQKAQSATEPGAASGVQTVIHVSHLRNLGMIVLAGTVSAALIDYVFKARASAAFTDGGQLLQFFGLFYTLAGIVTLAIQLLLTRVSMDRLGLSGMVASLPTTVLAGSIGGLFVPGLASAAVARASESVLRSSLFRSSYELFYTPVPPEQKRAAKPIIDVSVERLGDAIGAVTIQLLLFASTQGALTAMLLTSLVIATTTLVIARRLPDGYRQALESTLLSTPYSITPSDNNVVSLENRAPDHPRSDPATRNLLQLASEDGEVLRTALARMKPLHFLTVPRVIELLGRDDVTEAAAESLREVASSITGQLVDALTDPTLNRALRARIPAVLAASESRRAVDGLMDALEDRDFDIRFQAALALDTIKDRGGDPAIDSERVMKAVMHELDLPSSREAIRLQQMFQLLSLVFPKDPLRVAYRVLLADDAYFNGTALEYLETVLPVAVWQRMRKMIETENFRESVA